ncbi:hypothetical protein BC826DRAFT_1090838 [Russula brevipes]|nr:hypothetical protein BC826DRAFT_1090838 [Russula brevipes]
MSSELASFELSSPLTDLLNELLERLGLPFVLDTPLDLTPSLLLATLESLLQSRLPVSSSVRESRSDAAKVQAMKIFLGVLETDVINEDVGLSDIDPRRLAAGEWEEVVFIAKLLCWLGRQMGLLPSKDTDSSATSLRRSSSSTARGFGGRTGYVTGLPRNASPSTRSTATNSITSALSLDRDYEESDTTVQSVHSGVTDTRRPGDDRMLSQVGRDSRPQCIHEIEDPSFLAQEDDEELLRAEHESLNRDIDDTVDTSCHCPQDGCANTTYCSTDRSSGSVRYDGHIQEVDAGLELSMFEARKATKRLHTRSTPEKAETSSMPRYPTETRPTTRHTSPGHHALALLDERAKLLSKLASLDLNIADAFSGRS